MQNGKQRKFLVPHSYLLCIMLKLDHMAFYFFDTLCSTSYYKLSSLRIAIMWSEEEENAKKFKFYRELETISFLQFFLVCMLACFCLRSIREKVITFSELCEGHRHYWLDALNFEEGKDLNYVLVMTFFRRSSQREKSSSSLLLNDCDHVHVLYATYNFSLSLPMEVFSKLMSNFLYYTLFLVCTLQCTFMESWLIDAG